MRIARAAGRRVAFDIDYRPNLWGLAGHAAGEERYIRSDKVSEQLQDRACRLRPDRRHRGGNPHRRRRGGQSRRAPPHPRAVGGDDRPEARADGLRGFPRRDPEAHRRRHRRPRISDRGVQRARRRRRLHGRVSCAAGCGASRTRHRRPGRTPAAPSPSRGCSARRNIRPGSSCRRSSRRAARITRCAATRR